MATASQYIQQFVRSISEDIQRYQQLLVLIQQQKALYLQFDGELLNDNIQKQMPILNQIAHSTQERSQLMRSLGVLNNQSGVNRIFNALPSKVRVPARKQWVLLESLVLQCQQSSQSNGQSSAAFQELLNQIQQPAQHTYEESSF